MHFAKTSFYIFTAAALAACTTAPVNPTTTNPPGASSIPSPGPVTGASPESSPSNPGTTQGVLSLNLRGDSSLQSFATQQLQGLCLGDLKQIETQWTDAAGKTERFQHEVPTLAAFLTGFKMESNSLARGEVSMQSVLRNGRGESLGTLHYRVNFNGEGHEANVVFKSLGQQGDNGCPVLTADISGGSFVRAEGGLMLASDVSGPVGEIPTSPSSGDGAVNPSLSLPQQVRVVARSTSTLTLNWEIDNGLGNSYRLLLDDQEVAQGITRNNYTFSGLQANTSYRLGLQSMADGAVSEVVEVSAITTASGQSGVGNFSGGGSSGGGGASGANQGTPRLLSVAPLSGAVGSSVVLTGTNFSTTLNANTVKFGEVTAVVTSATPDSLTVTVPELALGVSQVTVTVGGQSTTALPFTVQSSPKGIVFASESAGEQLGISVSSAGDINGDGFDDFIMGANLADFEGASASGSSYLVFGGADIASLNTLSADKLNGSNGFAIRGFTAGEQVGLSVSKAGDVNGDGLDDLIIGAPLANSNSGKSYVIFGHQNLGKENHVGAEGHFNLNDLNGSNGFVLVNDSDFEQFGTSVASAGDINGDGVTDLLIGAPYAILSPDASIGKSYVVFGREGLGSSGNLNVGLLDGTNGFALWGEGPNNMAGFSVAGVGDVNGDGVDDFLVGAYSATPSPERVYAGKSYLIFGNQNLGESGHVGANGSSNLAGLDGSNGFSLDGEYTFSGSGYSVSGAGDVNGDGISDILIGEPGTPFQQKANVGKSYVVFGHQSLGQTGHTGEAGHFNLSALDGDNGFDLNGAPFRESLFGSSVAGVGDVNGDGADDLLIGSPYATINELSPQAGRSHLIFGSQTIGSGGSLNVADLAGADGFVLDGEITGAQSGYSVAGAGDINGDGLMDFMIGAHQFSPMGLEKAGKTYVLFGYQNLGSAGQVGENGIFALRDLISQD